MTAPTEAEIRSAIVAEWAAKPPVGPSAAVEFSDAFTGVQALLDGMWDAGALSEAADDCLNELAHDAIFPIHDQAKRQATEAMVRVGLQFLAEFPDAPRAESAA
jgi:hypothetical protein